MIQEAIDSFYIKFDCVFYGKVKGEMGGTFQYNIELTIEIPKHLSKNNKYIRDCLNEKLNSRYEKITALECKRIS